ncbi:CrcB family protein [Saccharopolyspora erythraea]|uniref:FluC/FEX family fluoride channel n=1 Tax=Saccharopolyspora erythraea TaxID=1836 RepID=UPI001BA86F3D|nr:CrcB family protein [Saccharopolyspora erythraea]QUH04066.1 CrcB family protein [Saccharopolyspora erythraea]
MQRFGKMLDREQRECVFSFGHSMGWFPICEQAWDLVRCLSRCWSPTWPGVTAGPALDGAMTSTVAMLLGGAVGVLLRMMIRRSWQNDTSPFRWSALAITAGGALAFGVLTGLAPAVANPGQVRSALSIGASSALFTYCVFNASTMQLLARAGDRASVVAAVVHAFVGFVAAVPGVLAGMALAG